MATKESAPAGRFNHTSMTKRAKEMIKEALRRALFITVQCLREANELAQGGPWIMGHYRPRL